MMWIRLLYISFLHLHIISSEISEVFGKMVKTEGEVYIRTEGDVYVKAEGEVYVKTRGDDVFIRKLLCS